MTNQPGMPRTDPMTHSAGARKAPGNTPHELTAATKYVLRQATRANAPWGVLQDWLDALHLDTDRAVAHERGDSDAWTREDTE